MDESTFGTVAVAVATPFDDEGQLDLPSFERLCDHLVTQGCDALVVSGTTGESPTTSDKEKQELVRVAHSVCTGRARVIAGAGSNCTAHAVTVARAAATAGADALLVVTPYYNKPSQRGIQAHIRAVAEATDLPVMLYDIPGRTGVALSDQTIMELAKIPQVQALKDATGMVEQGIRRAHESGLQWFSGDDSLNLAFLTQGASGVVSVVGHVAAAKYRAMFDAVQRSQLEEAQTISRGLEPLVQAVMGTGQGAVMAKAALAHLGIIKSATVRLPLVAASDEELANLVAVLQRYPVKA